MAQKRRPRTRRRERKNIPTGRAYIQSTFNNTIVTLTDPEGRRRHRSSNTTAARASC